MDPVAAERDLARHKAAYEAYGKVNFSAVGAEAVREVEAATKANRPVLKTQPLKIMLTDGTKFKLKSGALDEPRVDWTVVRLLDPAFVAKTGRERKSEYKDVLDAQKVPTVLKRLNVHQRKARIKALNEDIEDLLSKHRFERGNLEAPHATPEARQMAKKAWEAHLKEHKPKIKALRDELADHEAKQAEAPERKVSRRKLASTRKELADVSAQQRLLQSQLGALQVAFRKYGQAGTSNKQDEQRTTIENLLSEAMKIGEKPEQPDFNSAPPSQATTESSTASEATTESSISSTASKAQSPASEATSESSISSTASKAQSPASESKTKALPTSSLPTPVTSRKRPRPAGEADSSAVKKTRSSSMSSPSLDAVNTSLLGTPASAPSTHLFF